MELLQHCQQKPSLQQSLRVRDPEGGSCKSVRGKDGDSDLELGGLQNASLRTLMMTLISLFLSSTIISFPALSLSCCIRQFEWARGGRTSYFKRKQEFEDDCGDEEGSRMTPRFWLGSLSASPHLRKCRQNHTTRCFAVVMSELNQVGRWLQHRKLFRQDIQEWR